MTFAEFKTHATDLLDPRDEYRPGVWAPSHELVGGIAQSQATVHRATQEIGEFIRSTAADGSEILDDVTFLTRPRSFLVIGRLDQLIGEGGGPHRDKVRSFEMFRRGVVEPEIVTFDELLARAEWVIETASEGEAELAIAYVAAGDTADDEMDWEPVEDWEPDDETEPDPGPTQSAVSGDIEPDYDDLPF
jgi:hypothetical protein